MAEHTQGPWERQGPIIWSPGGKGVVCELSEPRAASRYVEHHRAKPGSPDREEIEANGHLLLAAPKLLAACQRFLAAHQVVMDDIETFPTSRARRCICGPCIDARAAIAEATGQEGE
jgi:hypothetical protein